MVDPVPTKRPVINKHSVGGAAAGAVIACCVVFTPFWEGTDYVAKPDMVGTGHPTTWCHGQTNVDRDAAHKVQAGQRFTKQECDAELAKSLPAYFDPVSRCVRVPVPVKAMASIVDAAYNAGPARVCQSPMVKQFNAGNIRAGCDAFDGWIVRGDGHVLQGLIARRAGELHGDKRKSERALCLEGLSDPKADWYLPSGAPHVANAPKPVATTPAPKPKIGFWSSLINAIFNRR